MREVLSARELRNNNYDSIVHLQNKRFRALCSYILPSVPFYKQLFAKYGVDPYQLRCVEDWQTKGLPLIKKATYMKNPKDFVCKPDEKTLFSTHFNYLRIIDGIDGALGFSVKRDKRGILKNFYSPKMLVFSGGTESGNPTPVLLTGKQKFENLSEIIEVIRDLVQDNLPEKRIGMNLFPYGPHLGWHAAHSALDIIADLNLCTAAGGAMPTERLVALADRAQPNIICGMSSYLRNRFLPSAIEHKIRLPDHVVYVNGAQKMHDAEREKIVQLSKKLGVKNCRILDLYSASEFKEALLPELLPGNGYYHLAPLSTIIRPVLVHGTSKEFIDDWEFSDHGPLASWNIDGGGTNLSGYLVGDSCEHVAIGCEQTQLNVQRFLQINRIKDIDAQIQLTGMVEEKIKGTRVNLVAIRDQALSLKDVSEAQVVVKQTKKGDVLELRYVTTAAERVRKQLEQMFAGSEVKPKLVRTTLDKLQTGKLKFEGIRRE